MVSIDGRRCKDGLHEAWTHSGVTPSNRSVQEVARQAELSGAGELLVTSVDQDGTMEGYDLELIRSVTEVVEIPVIASGGCGSPEHMADALEIGGASAVAAASVFHFTELTPLQAKNHLHDRSFPVRI